ncbi:acyl-CoA carboxylase subunit epsilon [Marinactinospora rubrisoli]|uniref:Acyl-CoA carboxylase subunit epsilon n=1 Tax=Marinactinospora rubrisoli TaxID=2715399 RepID=A0ABW2KN69_9ACTN
MVEHTSADPRGLALRVLRGRPTAAELAALVTVLAAVHRTATDPPSPAPAPTWTRPPRYRPPAAWSGGT